MLVDERRLDIQGLRAIAVLCVVIFHARLPLVGGFVGVDIFFVVSGFVITGILQSEWTRSSRIDFLHFWRRRFMRLTPALALLVSVTLLASTAILFPDQQKIAVQTGLGAMFLTANVVIARTTGGYFDGPAESNPLLNTWSLSVEEQYYFIFPFVLALGWFIARDRRSLKHAPLLLVLLVCAGSFGLALISHTEYAATAGVTWLNFYSPFVRAWEFAAGAMLVLVLPRVTLKSRAVSTWLGVLGVLGLIASVTTINSSMSFPGIWTALPVGATMLLLLAGSTVGNPVSAMLSIKPLTKLGDWSYSIYLWHWPFIVFATYLGVKNPAALVLVAIASVVPALISFRWVETPFRRMGRIPSRKLFARALAVIVVPTGMAVIVACVIEPVSMHEGEIGARYLSYIDQRSFRCSMQTVNDSEFRCRQTKEDGNIQVALIGDSHAEDLYPGLVDALPNTNISYMYWPNWPFTSTANTEAAIDEIVRASSIGSVIIGVRWTSEGSEVAALRVTVRKLSSAGKQVFIADGRPYFSFHARECKFQRPIQWLSQRCEEDVSVFQQEYDSYLVYLQSVVREFPSAHLLDTAGGFCDADICSMVKDEDLLMADQSHLNVLGSQYVVNRLLNGDPLFASAVQYP